MQILPIYVSFSAGLLAPSNEHHRYNGNTTSTLDCSSYTERHRTEQNGRGNRVDFASGTRVLGGFAGRCAAGSSSFCCCWQACGLSHGRSARSDRGARQCRFNRRRSCRHQFTGCIRGAGSRTTKCVRQVESNSIRSTQRDGELDSGCIEGSALRPSIRKCTTGDHQDTPEASKRIE